MYNTHAGRQAHTHAHTHTHTANNPVTLFRVARLCLPNNGMHTTPKTTITTKVTNGNHVGVNKIL